MELEWSHKADRNMIRILAWQKYHDVKCFNSTLSTDRYFLYLNLRRDKRFEFILIAKSYLMGSRKNGFLFPRSIKLSRFAFCIILCTRNTLDLFQPILCLFLIFAKLCNKICKSKERVFTIHEGALSIKNFYVHNSGEFSSQIHHKNLLFIDLSNLP